MKWKFILGALCMLLLTSPAVALADENTYIVTLNDTVSLYGLAENEERNYIVVSSEELTEYLDARIVAEYEPNYKVELLGENWNLDAINCDFAWELGCFGNEVRIGVIDSGLYPFPELGDNVIAGKNYLDGSADTTDNIGHGTFVTGIIASKSKGISYKSKIVPLKCFEKDKDTYVDDLLDAVYDAVDIYDCDVINMSIGFTGYSLRLERAIKYATNNGVIVVSAVGNDGNTTTYYPAAYGDVVGVGSTNQENTRSSFSQYNDSVFVTAPGEDLESLSIEGYPDNSGTSFSTPHVTALAAVAKCIDKDITTSEFKELLVKSSADLGTTGYDTYYGYGLIDFKEFIKQMIAEPPAFMFPLNIEDNSVYSVIYNNSDTELTVSCIYAQYEDDRLCDCIVLPVTIPTGQTYKFQNPYLSKTFKYMIWQNLKTLKPLTESREFDKR